MPTSSDSIGDHIVYKRTYMIASETLSVKVWWFTAEVAMKKMTDSMIT